MRSFNVLAALIGLANGGALVERQHTDDPHLSVLPSETPLAPSEHGMGLWPDPPVPTSDAIPDPIDRSKIFRSYNKPPVPRPGDEPSWSWVSDGNDEDALPRSVDWRDKWGVNWITSVQNQLGCGTCWAFAITALIESMTRVQHGSWDKRSEDDLFESSQRPCDGGWDYKPAFDFLVKDGHGLSDEMCNIYYDFDRPFLGCGDRAGRSLKLGNYTGLETIEDQKWWLTNVGPITCAVDIYDDFAKPGSMTNGVYHHDPNDKSTPGGHAMLIVGYDDDLQCWIVKNSWGPTWNKDGYIKIGYGEIRIDDFQNNTKYGVTNLDPDQWPRRRHRNGNILQTANGTTHRNIQVVRSTPDGNVTLLQRSGDERRKKWSIVGEKIEVQQPVDPMNRVWNFNATNGSVTGQPVFLETSFQRQREFVYWVKEKSTLAHWYYSEVDEGWSATGPIGARYYNDEGHGNITGYAGFIQNDDSNFTVVAKTTENDDSSLTEYNRDVNIGDWTASRFVAPDGILQSGPSLIQSNVGLNLSDHSSAGNLYVVAVLKTNQLQLFWRCADELSWHAGEVFGEGIPDTPPVMIQDFWDTQYEYSIGGFQLLVAKDGYVEHWQRINDDIIDHPPEEGQQGKWENVGWFGEGNIKHVWGLVQGSFNFALEAIVETDDGELWHWEYTGEWKCGKQLPSGGEDKDAESWEEDSGYGTEE